MRRDAAIAGCGRDRHGIQRLGDGANLVQLHQQGIAHSLGNALLENRQVGDEDVVADQLHLVAELLGQQLPAGPIRFGQAVLDRDHGILPCPVGPHRDHGGRVKGALARSLEIVSSVAGVELAGRRVEGDEHVLAGLVARLADGFHHHVERVAVRFEIGCEAALVADAGGEAPAFQD